MRRKREKMAAGIEIESATAQGRESQQTSKGIFGREQVAKVLVEERSFHHRFRLVKGGRGRKGVAGPSSL